MIISRAFSMFIVKLKSEKIKLALVLHFPQKATKNARIKNNHTLNSYTLKHTIFPNKE